MRQSRVPEGFVEQYGQPELWNNGTGYSWPAWVAGSLCDQCFIWIVAQREVDSFTGVGLLVDGQAIWKTGGEIKLSDLFQAALWRWKELSHPFERGGLLPAPVRILAERDEQGRICFPIQPRDLDHCLKLIEGEIALVYSYNRAEYRVERVPSLCDETREGFRLVKLKP